MGPQQAHRQQKGFDLSLFVKPGEWKCDACLVRNVQDVDQVRVLRNAKVSNRFAGNPRELSRRSSGKLVLTDSSVRLWGPYRYYLYWAYRRADAVSKHHDIRCWFWFLSRGAIVGHSRLGTDLRFKGSASLLALEP